MYNSTLFIRTFHLHSFPGNTSEDRMKMRHKNLSKCHCNLREVSAYAISRYLSAMSRSRLRLLLIHHFIWRSLVLLLLVLLSLSLPTRFREYRVHFGRRFSLFLGIVICVFTIIIFICVCSWFFKLFPPSTIFLG